MKKLFPEILLFIVLIINILFSQIDPLFSYSLLCIYFFINFTSKIYSPYLYIMPGSIYLYPLLYRFSSDNIYEFKELIIFFIIGTLCFSTIYKYASKLELKIKNFKKINYKNLDKILLIFYIIFAAQRITRTSLYPDIIKGLTFLSIEFITASIFGALIAISKKNLLESYIKSIPYLIILILTNIITNDNVSRIYVLFYIVLIFAITITSTKDNKFSINLKTNVISAESFFKSIATFIFCITFSRKDILTGGDFMVVSNALEIIKNLKSTKNFEPLMPFHNGLFIYFPQRLLPFIKPENYNVSSWITENLYDINPEIAFGTSSTLVGAAYLYGGIFGVLTIFSLLGLVLIYIEHYVDSYFFLGFYIFIIMKLPLVIFRMDETFLAGTIITFIIIIPFFHKFIRKIIYSTHN